MHCQHNSWIPQSFTECKSEHVVDLSETKLTSHLHLHIHETRYTREITPSYFPEDGVLVSFSFRTERSRSNISDARPSGEKQFKVFPGATCVILQTWNIHAE